MAGNPPDLLPAGQYLIGFDESGFSIAASIIPNGRDSFVFDGCSEILLCELAKGGNLFGRHKSEFTVKGGE